jgi:hypothetical protein
VKGIANTMLPGGVLHEQREQYGAVLDDLASSASALAKAKAALAQHDAAKKLVANKGPYRAQYVGTGSWSVTGPEVDEIVTNSEKEARLIADALNLRDEGARLAVELAVAKSVIAENDAKEVERLGDPFQKAQPASGAQSEESETRRLLMKTTGCLGLLISKYKPTGPAYAETYAAAKAYLHSTPDESDAARAAQSEEGGR